MKYYILNISQGKQNNHLIIWSFYKSDVIISLTIIVEFEKINFDLLI